MNGLYLLLLREEYDKGYYTWIGRTQRHYPYELIQTFDNVADSTLYLVVNPNNVTEPAGSNVEGESHERHEP